MQSVGANKGEDSALKVVQSIFSGGLKAARTFDFATGGCRLSDASEHFLTAGIFESLSKLKGFTHLEVPVKACMQEANAIHRGKPSALERQNGRYDLVHYRVNETPRVAIEVKNCIKHVNRSVLIGDFARLSRSLTASGQSSYQFCAFVFFATADYRQKLESLIEKRRLAQQRLRTVLKGVEQIASEFTAHKRRPLLRRIYKSKFRYSPFEDEGAWAIGMVIFADKRAAGTFPRKLVG